VGFENILQSLLIGISLAAAPGPLFFEFTRRALTEGFWSGISVSLGSLVGTTAFLIIIFLGASQLLVNPIASVVSYIVGVVILLYLAYSTVTIRAERVSESYRKTGTLTQSALAGFLIGISNPVVIAFWISISGTYIGLFNNLTSAFVTVFLIVVGILILEAAFIGFISITKKRIPARFVVGISRVFGVVLFGYALYFLYRLILLLV